MSNGKGSARRRENFRAVQDNWAGINWGKSKLDSEAKRSECCNSPVWVEGKTTQFYVCGNCDRSCGVMR